MTTSPTPAAAEIVYLPLSKIVDHPHNVRSDLGDLDALIKSIEASGVKLPIIVLPERTEAPHKGKHYLVDGHRRRAAAAKTKAKAPVPALVQILTEAEVIELMLIAGIQQADISPLDEARGYAMLVELDSTPATIAKTVGRSAAHVKGRLALLQLPAEILALVATGDLTLERAAELLTYVDDEIVMAWILEQFKEGNRLGNLEYSVRQFRTEHAVTTAMAELTAELTTAGATIYEPPLDQYQRAVNPQLPSTWDPFRLTRPATLKAMELTAAQSRGHAKEPCHATWLHVDRWAKTPVTKVTVCTDPKRHSTKVKEAARSTIQMKPAVYKPTAQRTNGQHVPAPKLRKAMNTARNEHAATQLEHVTITPELLTIVLCALNDRGGEARAIAADLLGISTGNKADNYEAFHSFAAKPENLNRALAAIALATCKLHDWSPGLHGLFLEWLGATGYTPVDDETPWLEKGIKALAKARKDDAARVAKADAAAAKSAGS